MAENPQPKNDGGASRRDFMKTSTAAAVGGAVLSQLAVPRMAHAAGDDLLKIGLIGCGGRGTGAAVQAMRADKNCKLVTMADAFADRLEMSKKSLQRSGGDKFAVTDDMCFVGFDAYKKVLASDVDVVILTTPPHFRPEQYRAAIEAGKHCFVEKPVAVDAPGYRSVLETNQLARDKKLAVVSGLCWRYDHGVRATMEKIQDGAIGDIVAVQSVYNTGQLWHRGDDPKWSRMEYQLRNWLYYAWLSGDHNVEQHIHSLDKSAWLMGDAHPIKAWGLGGRQQRTDPKYGHIFDHHAVMYEYPGGKRVFAYCRQQNGCANQVDETVMGVKGTARILANRIESEGEKWRFRGPKPNMYQVEHNELFASIRKGAPIHNGDYMANSTMIAIMGRMVTYTGQELTWEEVTSSKERLGPTKYEWGDLPEPPVAIPGETKFA